MSIFEYDEERHLAYLFEKGFREGFKEGFEEGREEGFEEGREEGFEEGREEVRKEKRNHLIADAFEILLKVGASEEEAISAICEQYSMEPEEVREMIRLGNDDLQQL